MKAKYSNQEQNEYEESLKVYRDLKNVVDSAYDEGKIEGRIEGKQEGLLLVVQNLKEKGVDVNFIMEAKRLSKAVIEKL